MNEAEAALAARVKDVIAREKKLIERIKVWPEKALSLTHSAITLF